MKNRKKMSAASIRRLKIGSYGMVVTAIVIALVVFVNLIVSTLPVTLTHFNTQKVDYAEIGSESQKIIDSIDSEIVLYLIAEKGSEDQRIEELLAHYDALSDNISVKTLDPVTNPTFIDKHTDENVAANSIIAVSGKRSRVVHYSDMYITHFYAPDGSEISEDYYNMYLQYGYEAYYDTLFEGEMAITSALEYTSREILPTLYTLTGHGEASLDEYYSAYLEVENVATATLNLASTESVPVDSEIVLIMNPTKDLSDEEAAKLAAYVEEGGDVVFITDYRFARETLPNFASIAAKAGLEAEEGVIVQDSYYAFYPEIVSSGNGITSLVNSQNTNAVISTAHGIKSVSDTSATVKTLLQSSNKAEMHTVKDDGTTAEKDGYVSGDPIAVGVLSETAVASDKRDGVATFVWYSSTAITDINVAYQYGTGNLQLFLATVSHLCEKSTTVSIIGKSLMIEPVIFTEAESNFWMVAMTIVVPAAILGAGFYVWFRRRRR